MYLDTKMCLDTSILAKSIMGRREYNSLCFNLPPILGLVKIVLYKISTNYVGINILISMALVLQIR
jgi:hypothetical protein